MKKTIKKCCDTICILSKNTPVEQKQKKKHENDPRETTIFDPKNDHFLNDVCQ